MILFVLAVSAYCLFISLIMQTKNLMSAMVFKVIPFFLGAGAMLYYLIEMNIFGGK